jgi:hypothetical protein
VDLGGTGGRSARGASTLGAAARWGLSRAGEVIEPEEGADQRDRRRPTGRAIARAGPSGTPGTSRHVLRVHTASTPALRRGLGSRGPCRRGLRPRGPRPLRRPSRNDRRGGFRSRSASDSPAVLVRFHRCIQSRGGSVLSSLPPAILQTGQRPRSITC